jgi:hypothetical protein
MVFCLVTAAVALAEGEIPVNLNSPEEVNIDGYFICLVEVSGVSNLNAAQFDITFDPSILELEGCDSGNINGDDLPVMCKETDAGHFNVLASASLDVLNGDGYLAKLTFYAKGAGTSAIQVSEGLLSGIPEGEIPSIWTGSSVTVISDDSDGSSSASDSGSETVADNTEGQLPDSTVDTGEETGTVSEGSSIKWPVIWGVSGFVVLIIALVIYANLRRPLY